MARKMRGSSGSSTGSGTLLAPIHQWFELKGWDPLPFQKRAWDAFLAGHSGLIQVPTGSGKTFAAVMGPIARMLSDSAQNSGIRLVYITPLRALSRDLALAIREPIDAMGWPLRVGIRNGDSSSSERSKQLKSPPQILITTPESLTLLISNGKAEELFGRVNTIILDEWHELMGSKRGSQTELCLGWLRQQRPQLQTWAISATIGNLDQAARHALGGVGTPVIVGEAPQRCTDITSILPDNIDGFRLPLGRASGITHVRGACGKPQSRYQHAVVHQHAQSVRTLAPVPAVCLSGNGRRPGAASQRHRPA